MGNLVYVSADRARPDPKLTKILNQLAVELASYLIVDDIKSALIKNQRTLTATRVEDLLGWAQIEWRTTSRQYDADYEANEVTADNDFKGKRILITGTVDSIEKDFTDSVFLTLRTPGILGVHANLDQQAAHAAASLRKGQQIDLVCIGSGRVLTIATLDHCQTFDDFVAVLSPLVESKVTGFLSGKIALDKKTVLTVTSIYFLSLNLPSNSACINGRREKCAGEMEVIFKDKARGKIILDQANQMLTTLKVD